MWLDLLVSITNWQIATIENNTITAMPKVQILPIK